MRHNLLAFALVLLAALSSTARAAEPVAGDACSTANLIVTTGGPETSGVRSYLICTGGVWVLQEKVTATGSVGIGATTPAAKLHVGGEVIFGNTSLACSGTTEGAMRYNATSKYMEFCNGTAWTAAAQVQGSSPPTAPSGSGYFVMSKTQWDGNLGGISGADAKCLTELSVTNTGWNGYADANSRGLLTASKVKAFICAGGPCSNLMPLTTYYYADANSATNGGASFTTDGSGVGAPNDTVLWSAANRFGGNYYYWGGRGATSCNGGNSWPAIAGAACNGNPGALCNVWTTNSNGVQGQRGRTDTGNYARWAADVGTNCDVSANLVCFVNP